jgi:HPt (histidine-containing phosphotransfer) domain-containing protein
LLTGGKEVGYKKVLESFCQDAWERLEILSKTPDEAALPLFITQVHALKSASASVGADEISHLAADLEDAGNNRSIDFIEARLATFRESLSLLVYRIKQALESYRSDSQNEMNFEKTNSASNSTYSEILLRLSDALRAENVGQADALLEELGAMPIGPETKEKLLTVAGLVLTSDFKDAAVMIDGLVKEHFR